MKKVYFLTLAMALALVSCNQKNKENAPDSPMNHQDTTTTHSDTSGIANPNAPADEQAALYSCPMHPEVHGKKDSECPKCGMKLTEPVTKKQD